MPTTTAQQAQYRTKNVSKEKWDDHDGVSNYNDDDNDASCCSTTQLLETETKYLWFVTIHIRP